MRGRESLRAQQRRRREGREGVDEADLFFPSFLSFFPLPSSFLRRSIHRHTHTFAGMIGVIIMKFKHFTTLTRREARSSQPQPSSLSSSSFSLLRLVPQRLRLSSALVPSSPHSLVPSSLLDLPSSSDQTRGTSRLRVVLRSRLDSRRWTLALSFSYLPLYFPKRPLNSLLIPRLLLSSLPIHPCSTLAHTTSSSSRPSRLVSTPSLPPFVRPLETSQTADSSLGYDRTRKCSKNTEKKVLCKTSPPLSFGIEDSSLSQLSKPIPLSPCPCSLPSNPTTLIQAKGCKCSIDLPRIAFLRDRTNLASWIRRKRVSLREGGGGTQREGERELTWFVFECRDRSYFYC